MYFVPETAKGSSATMKEVNIYLYTTIRGTRAKRGAYCYVLEMNTAKGPATLTNSEQVEEMTAHRAELTAFVAALKRILKSSRLTVYTDSHYLAVNTMDCLASWKKNGWKNAKGLPVKHKEEWQEVYELIRKHGFKFEVSSVHSYYQWMKKEAEAVVECT